MAEMRATNSAAQVASGAGRAAGSAQSDKDAEDPNLRERKRVATVKALLRPNMRGGCRDAAVSKVFPIAQWHNRLLLDSARAALGVSAAAASKFLHQKVMFPSTHKKKDYVEKPVYRYLKQTLSYFYTTIRLTAVRVFIDRVYEHSRHTIGRMDMTPDVKRSRLVLSKKEALSLLTGDNFLTDVHAWPALVDALAAVMKRLGAGDKFTEPNPMAGGTPFVLCLSGHVALVAFKVQEHLKLIGEVTEQSQGMNAGHRGKRVTMLSTLNGKFEMSAMPQRGLRLLDGTSTERALPEAEASEKDALSFSSDDSGSEEGGAGDETGSQAVSYRHRQTCAFVCLPDTDALNAISHIRP